MSKNDRVPDPNPGQANQLRDIHGLIRLARIVGITLAAVIAAIAIVILF